MGLTIFTVDDTTQHPGVTVEDDVISRTGSGGWVTLKATQTLTPTNKQWAVKVINQGEGTDGSGLMLGLLPKINSGSLMSSKYISEMGGWCISRAGESYGSWKCDRLPFGTGCVVEFELDLPGKALHMICGKQKVVGSIPQLVEGAEYYPAVSVYYNNQKVMFV